MNEPYDSGEVQRAAQARESFSGRLLTDTQFEDAMAITGIIGISILNLYTRSIRTYNAQLQVTEIQQNLRAGLDALVADLRMAGYAKGSDAEVGLVNAGRKSVQFTMDLTRDGDSDDANENLIYSLYKSGKIPRLGRKSAGGNNSPVAEYIEAIGFAYAFDSNNVTVTQVFYACR